MGFAEFNLEMEIQLINGNKQNKPILQFQEETQRERLCKAQSKLGLAEFTILNKLGLS